MITGVWLPWKQILTSPPNAAYCTGDCVLLFHSGKVDVVVEGLLLAATRKIELKIRWSMNICGVTRLLPGFRDRLLHRHVDVYPVFVVILKLPALVTVRFSTSLDQIFLIIGIWQWFMSCFPGCLYCCKFIWWLFFSSG